MSEDVFVWGMTAYDRKSSILAFRNELKSHHQSQTPFPVSLILSLLPIKTGQQKEILQRGSFSFHGDRFENVAADELRVMLDDPAMKQYTIIIPARWQGTLTVEGELLTLKFDTPIKLIVPRLDELGVNRTDRQVLQSMQSDLRMAQSILLDEAGIEDGVVKKIIKTVIDVEFDPKAPRLIPKPTLDAGKIVILGPESCAFAEPSARDWYVYRGPGGSCVVNEGTISEPGYTKAFGPDTKDNCDYWVGKNC